MSQLERLRILLLLLGIPWRESLEGQRVRTERAEGVARTTVTISSGVGAEGLRGSFYFDAEGRFLSHALYESPD